jgi:hypothetical protein
VNVDGAYNFSNGSSACGGILKDHNGVLMAPGLACYLGYLICLRKFTLNLVLSIPFFIGMIGQTLFVARLG